MLVNGVDIELPNVSRREHPLSRYRTHVLCLPSIVDYRQAESEDAQAGEAMLLTGTYQQGRAFCSSVRLLCAHRVQARSASSERPSSSPSSMTSVRRCFHSGGA